MKRKTKAELQKEIKQLQRRIAELEGKEAAAEQRARETYARLQGVIEGALDLVFLRDRDGRYVLCNTAAVRALGKESAEEVVGKDDTDLIPEELARQLQENDRTIMEAGQSVEYEEEIMTVDGLRLFRTMKTPYRNETGAVAGVIGVARDITERKRVEDALMISEKRHRSYIELTGQLGWTTNANGEVMEPIPTWRAYTGQSYDEMKGWGWTDAIHPNDVERTSEIWQEAVRTRSTYETEFRVRGKDGEYKWFLAKALPLLDQSGSILEWVGTCVDINEIKGSNAQLEASNQQLRATEQQLRASNQQLASGNQQLRATEQHLTTSNQQLRGTERQLRQYVELLDATGRMAKVGGWEVDTKTLEVKWTEETYRLHEVHLDHRPHLQEAINFFHPEEQPKLKDAIHRAIEHGEPYDMELRFITAKGNHLWTHTYCEPEIVDGKTVRLKGVFQDITDRKRAEEEIRKHRDHLKELVEERTRELSRLTWEQQVILDTVPAMIWFKDTQNKVIRVNKAAAAAFGMTPEQLAGKSLTELQPEKADQHYQDDLEVFRTKKPKFGIVKSQALAGGEKGWVITDKIPYLDAHGDMAGLIGLSVDITDRVRAEEDLKRYSAQLEAANKDMEAFAYSVSHDLRAPLRSINGFSEALLEDYADNVDEQGKDHLRRVRASAQRMAKLIDDLLQLSRITRWKMEYTKVDISGLARKTVATLRQSQPGRDVDVVIEDGLVADGDTSLLRVVMHNLLGNAWKFTGKTANARIEVGKKMISDIRYPISKAAYFVRDNGVGFDMAYADKLFEAFQRLHSTAEFEGTGIGLDTVQRVILRHGGRVWAEGDVGKGATFYFMLK